MPAVAAASSGDGAADSTHAAGSAGGASLVGFGLTEASGPFEPLASAAAGGASVAWLASGAPTITRPLSRPAGSATGRRPLTAQPSLVRGRNGTVTRPPG